MKGGRGKGGREKLMQLCLLRWQYDKLSFHKP